MTAKLIEESSSYFPEKPLEIFYILNNEKWNDTMDNENLGQEQFRELAEDFLMDGDLLKDQWEELLIQLEDDDDFDEMKNVSARDFWGHYLSKISLTIPPDLRKLISNVVSIPIGSADAERAFSVMNHIKHDRRGLLSEKYLEDFLRI